MVRKRQDIYWYQDDVNLITDALVGPFNFNKGYLIDDLQWQNLQQAASKQGIDTQDIHQVSPLR